MPEEEFNGMNMHSTIELPLLQFQIKWMLFIRYFSNILADAQFGKS